MTEEQVGRGKRRRRTSAGPKLIRFLD